MSETRETSSKHANLGTWRCCYSVCKVITLADDTAKGIHSTHQQRILAHVLDALAIRVILRQEGVLLWRCCQVRRISRRWWLVIQFWYDIHDILLPTLAMIND